MDNEILFNILRIAVVVIGILITRFLIPWIKSKTEGTNIEIVLHLISDLVDAAEQAHYGEKGTGKEKKAEVMNLIKQYCEKRHIGLSEDQISALIESAVWALNYEKREKEELVAVS